MPDSSDTGKAWKVLVSGSRDWNDWRPIEAEFARVYEAHGSNVVLIHGNARGLDKMAARVATKKQWLVTPIDAEWDRLGRKAGIVRNVVMLDEEPDEVIAFRLDQSKGTTHLIETARKVGYDVKVIEAFTKHEPKGTMNMATNEEIAQIVAAVLAAQGQTATVPLTKSSNDAEYDPTVKDLEGKPLKLSGNGVVQVDHFAAKGCNRCGGGNVGWVESREAVYTSGPREGEKVHYLAQGYAASDGRLVLLKWQRHSDYCASPNTTPPASELANPPVSTQEAEGEAVVDESTTVESIDDQLEAARADEASGTFDGFTHAEVDELGDDVGMGFSFYGSLPQLEQSEKKSE